jgi:hypothetical protein
MATRRYANIQRSATIPDPAIILSKILFVIGPISCVYSLSLHIVVTCLDKILSAIMIELNMLEIRQFEFSSSGRHTHFFNSKESARFFQNSIQQLKLRIEEPNK